MRVSRIQAEQNRQAVIDAASRLFREHGFDGVGLKDLMEGAGLTQGAFYKQFSSKEDLAAQASGRALESVLSRWSAAAAENPTDPFGAVLDFYLSMGHRAERKDGCPIVALGSDAARQGTDVKAAFEDGIRKYLEMIGPWIGTANVQKSRAKAMAIASTMVGAVLIARAVNDEKLAKQFIQASAKAVRATLSEGDAHVGTHQ